MNYEFEKSCNTCKWRNTKECVKEYKCLDEAKMHPDWEPEQWLVEWLNSFDISSATECFTAVNRLKEVIEDDDKGDEENKVLKKVLLSELDIGQKFYFDGNDHECVVLHKITGNYGIVVYYKYIVTPSKLYSRYGDLFEVTVKEAIKNG